MDKTEEWRPCACRPCYDVSNRGRVRCGELILKGHFRGKTLCVGLRHGPDKRVPVSFLVAEAFGLTSDLASLPRTYRVKHLNGDRGDCSLRNLLLVPRQSNTDARIALASALRDEGQTYRMIEKVTDVKAHTLRRYRQRKGCAIRPREETSEQQLLRQLATWQELVGAEGGSHQQPEE